MYPESKIEVGGFVARHYDLLLNILTFWGYDRLTSAAIKAMGIRSGERIIDFGAGTGRNAFKMAMYLAGEGEIVGVDISDEMLQQFRKNCCSFTGIRCEKLRIDEPLPWKGEFDKVFMSFVLHGLPHDVRLRVIDNAHEVLKGNGKLFILDYGSFNIGDTPFYFRIPFRLVECKYAFDFVGRDWKKILEGKGFRDFKAVPFFKSLFRLISVLKR